VGHDRADFDLPFVGGVGWLHGYGLVCRWQAVVSGLGRRYEPAATIAGFAFDPLIAKWVADIDPAITHLRGVLGGQTYEALARKGETMITAEMATYTYDQIDPTRVELHAVSESIEDIRESQSQSHDLTSGLSQFSLTTCWSLVRAR